MRSGFPAILFLMMILLGSCSTTRVLEEGEYLLRKSEVVVEAEESTGSRAVEKDLSDYLQQKTNQKFLGLFPVRLWLYNLPGDSVPEKGLKHWIKHTLGEPPVLYRGYQEEATIDRIGSALQNRGFFHYRIDPQKEINNKKLTMIYRVELERPYRIGQVRFPEPADTLTRLIHSYREGSLVRTGDRYRLETMVEERERITGKLGKKASFTWCRTTFISDWIPAWRKGRWMWNLSCAETFPRKPGKNRISERFSYITGFCSSLRRRRGTRCFPMTWFTSIPAG
jgi:hypothetical protein